MLPMKPGTSGLSRDTVKTWLKMRFINLIFNSNKTKGKIIMRTCKTMLLLSAALFCTASTLYAEDQTPQQRPYIGIRLDGEPVPELLTKHLGLEPEQGIVIKNVVIDNPGDKAGLDRNDIIIELDGQAVYDYREFVKSIRQSEIGTEITLKVVQVGNQKTVTLNLQAALEEVEWKYPPEPGWKQSWHPGKVFRLKPGDNNWSEVEPWHKDQDDHSNFFKKFFNEIYTYQYNQDNESFTITIMGNPKDQDSMVVVDVGDTKHSTTIKNLKELPEKYLDSAENALAEARKVSGKRMRFKNFSVPTPMEIEPQEWKKYLYEKVERGGEVYEKLQEQMEKLKEQMKKLEESQKEFFNNLNNKLKEIESLTSEDQI